MRIKNLSFSLKILLLGASLIFCIISFSSSKLTQIFCSYSSYYIILGLFFFWLAKGLALIPKPLNGRAWLQQNWQGLFFSLLLTAIIFASVPCYFRILSDETNLLAVSKSMLYERRIDNVTMGSWYYESFHPIASVLPTRPFLYPFFTFLLHCITGYRPENAFAVNFLTLFVIFFLVYQYLNRKYGGFWPIAALVLIASQPVVVQTAASGGFDLLFVLFALIVFFSLSYFLQKESEGAFHWLFANLLMLAHVRYETPLFLALVLICLFAMRRLKISFFSSSCLYALTPLFLVPIAWLKWVQFQKSSPFQAPPGVPSFSLQHFINHAREFFYTFAHFNFYLPYATAINILGIIAVAYFVFQFFRKKWLQTNAEKNLFLISLFSVLAYYTLIFSYYAGLATHPTSSRYFVLICIIFSIFAVLFAHRFSFLRRFPSCFLLISFAIFLLYYPAAVQDNFPKTLTSSRFYKITLHYLKKISGRDFLIITTRPGQYTVQNYGTVSFQYANTHKRVFLNQLNQHLYEDIYVLQDISYATQKPTLDSTLDPDFSLQTLREIQYQGNSFLRISHMARKDFLPPSDSAQNFCPK